MFLAHAASLRSTDLSRQVGAVIRSRGGDVIATGANDVPQAGGGQYWPGPEDQRDHIKGFDSNKREIDDIVADTLRRANAVRQVDIPRVQSKLRPGRLFDLTEFGRAVHAEMDALLACARTATSAREATMYVTTFPCHNCAKHIVAAGVSKVFYVEPYPKSRAIQLHPDAIHLTQKDGAAAGQLSNEVTGSARAKVEFTPFVGVAARRYFDLFSMKLSTGAPVRRASDGSKIEWVPIEGPTSNRDVAVVLHPT